MPVRIKCAATIRSTLGDVAHAGQYLVAYDPEAYGGRGEAEWSFNPAEAMIFADAAAALAEWKRVPAALPLRPDGKPNRPLSAVTIEIETIL